MLGYWPSRCGKEMLRDGRVKPGLCIQLPWPTRRGQHRPCSPTPEGAPPGRQALQQVACTTSGEAWSGPPPSPRVSSSHANLQPRVVCRRGGLPSSEGPTRRTISFESHLCHKPVTSQCLGFLICMLGSKHLPFRAPELSEHIYGHPLPPHSLRGDTIWILWLQDPSGKNVFPGWAHTLLKGQHTDLSPEDRVALCPPGQGMEAA